MGRQLRIEYAGATYHVMSRGNHRQTIFRDDMDHERFLETLAEACGRTGWRVHAYVLMGNHYHLLLETPEANLVAGMRWLQGTYTKRFNIRHGEGGHLLQGRYKALVVDGREHNYFSTVANYVHLNPARIQGADFENLRLEDWRWSSYPAYLNPSLRTEWLSAGRVLSSLGFEDSRSGRNEYSDYIKRRLCEMQFKEKPWEADELWRKIRRGWYLGDKDFRDELIEQMDTVVSGKRRDSFAGEAVRLHDESEAERLVRELMDQLSIQEDDLESMLKSDPHKKVIAWKVRRQTVVRNEWIARRLIMGNTSNLSRFVLEVEVADDGVLKKIRDTIK